MQYIVVLGIFGLAIAENKTQPSDVNKTDFSKHPSQERAFESAIQFGSIWLPNGR